ncbi:MAG: POTRA domain-containing protein, partial [Planctomycetota bacterium JB042]
MGRAPLLLLLLSLVASGYRNVREGETVLEMTVVGNDRLTDEQVLSGLRTQVGRPLVATDVTADVRDLYSRYGVRVTVVQDVRAGGVALTFRVDEEALVQGVVVRGVDSGRGRELLDEIGLSGARALLIAQVRSRADELVARLREEGHAFAAVDVAVEDRDGRPVAV